MSIIKQADIPSVTGLPTPTLQQLPKNPPYAYRELLMAEGEGPEDPIPYVVEATEGQPNWFRIPHGLSVGAPARSGLTGSGASPNTVTDVDARIPDVAMPILVEWADVFTHLTRPSIALLSHPGAGSTTGWWADESYIYVAVSVAATGFVAFAVYVEFTHSVITNEIVTGEIYDVTPS